MIRDYIIQNWALILVLAAFAVLLKATVHVDKRDIRRMYVLICVIFVLSIVEFVEHLLGQQEKYTVWRSILTAVKYSVTPFIVAPILYTMFKKLNWIVYVPAGIHALLCFISIFTGFIFSIDQSNRFHRGPLGVLPFIVCGLYVAVLAYILIRRSYRQITELIPVAFLVLATLSDVLLPFVWGEEFSHMFCTTIAVALFVYYVFTIIHVTKKDPLTELFNRQAYYADLENDPEEISAIVSLDMNGLKATNDTYGHAEGDEALLTLARCFRSAARRRQFVYRVGGDEFMIVCRSTSRMETIRLVERIRINVAETKYSCSIGYCYADHGQTVEQMIKESDDAMYAEKEEYYKTVKRAEDNRV